MLLGNYNIFNNNPGRAIGGPTDPTLFYKRGRNMNFYTGDAYVSGETEKASFSNGYIPPYSWILAPKSGGMAASQRLLGTGDVTFGNLAGGLNAEAPLTGSGDITNAALGLILSAVAALTGSGTVTGDILGKLEAVAALTGTGDITAALGALASLVGALTGSGTLVGDTTALAGISADITVSGDIVTAESCAQAVWSALAAAFNDPGTMGEKMNNAASAGDPWGTALPGAYAVGTAGEILGSKALTEDDLTKIADIVLRRTTANVEASGSGDTLSLKSLYGMISQGVHNTQVSGSTLTVTKSDDATVLGTRTVTTSSTAEPIIGIDTD